ncbi:MAG: argininosuccinate lyase [Deltaproteobacteria bacterium]|nr:argininosuccinate lyase [Deltaproteobacteria bacterium]
MSKQWGGRFEKPTHAEVEVFTASIGVDGRLWDADIRGSVAHARMLGAVAVITPDEASKIIKGLEAVHADIQAGTVKFKPEAEDIHSEVERLLAEKLGPLAGKLHTARSRNDQVVTATRLYLRAQSDALHADLKSLQTWLVDASSGFRETIMPGLTHTQHAQPVSLGHHLMAYFWMFQRDIERLASGRVRINMLPLGSAALAGTSFALDRKMVATELGFAGVTANSLDAVSDRDFVVEFLSTAVQVVTHLSRLSEELIVWSTPEFGFLQLDDSVTTGSSIMPQKKNPDVAELIRGKVGRVTGALVGALTMLKALPLSYNRDLQEDKTFLFEGLDTTRACTRLMTLMLENARFNAERMKAAVKGDFSNATDLADYLVTKGMPFRQAHEVVGGVVRFAIERDVGLEDLTLAQLQENSSMFGADTLALLQPTAVMHARTSEGGTSPERVKEQIALARQLLAAKGD